MGFTTLLELRLRESVQSEYGNYERYWGSLVTLEVRGETCPAEMVEYAVERAEQFARNGVPCCLFINGRPEVLY